MVKPRNNSRSHLPEELLVTMHATDTSPRSLITGQKINLKCSVCFQNPKDILIDRAKSSLNRKDQAYKCRVCNTKTMRENRGEGSAWLENMRKSCQTEEKKNIARQNGINSRRLYGPEMVTELFQSQGITWEGDLSSPNNTITITWADGVSRRSRIRRLVQGGIVQRPKEGGGARAYLEKSKNLGVEIAQLEPNLYKWTYRGQSWIGKGPKTIDTRCLKKMKLVDIGHEIDRLLKQGTSLVAACKQTGVDHLRYYRNKKIGIDHFQTALSTSNFAKLIDIPTGIYNRKLNETVYRPDILVPEIKLIIECDGLYFHHEGRHPKRYHFDKWEAFNKLGYKVLVFSEYEIKEKNAIIQSMISHRRGKSVKVYGSKTEAFQMSNEEVSAFFDRCHLRGKGQGIGIGLRDKKTGLIVAAIRYRVSEGELHISRFACELGHAVVGGYSKLLSKIPQNLPIVNFVDRRHGSGEHLLNLGFVKEKVHLGFEWTDNYHHYNRRKFLGNTGYEKGLKKYWDYGQVKYTKLPKVSPVSTDKE